jgi:upstream activation factor subunit UAF30
MASTNNTDIATALASLRDEIKALRKDLRKVKQHIEDPSGEKAKARSLNNGFRKPQNVSPELKAFLSMGPEDRISRADVTKRINEYVTAAGLKKGQHILLDDQLRSLLNPPEDVQLTFLNIQRYINPHYIKEVPVVDAAEASTEVPTKVAEPVKKPTLKKALPKA